MSGSVAISDIGGTLSFAERTKSLDALSFNDRDRLSTSSNAELNHSSGNLLLTNGESYSGSLLSNLPEGFGKYVWADGCIYEGEWRLGMRHGNGKITWPSGAVYEGEFSGGYIHGTGTYSGSGKFLYRGRWRLNLKHGLGYQAYESGDVFDGSWMQGMPEGPGKYTWANGNVYIGNMKGGKMSGKGTLTWSNGDSFEGNWLNGMMHEFGVYTWIDGGCYFGTWTRGLKDGKGSFYPNGSRLPPGQELYLTALRKRGLLPDLKKQNNTHIQHASTVDMGNMKIGGNQGSRRNSTDKISKGNLLNLEQSRNKNVSLERRWSLEVAIEKVIGHDSSVGLPQSMLDIGENVAGMNMPILEREYMQGVLISELVLDNSFSATSRRARRRQKKLAKEAKRLGETIIKGHRSYDLMLSLQLGIRILSGIQLGKLLQYRNEKFGHLILVHERAFGCYIMGLLADAVLTLDSSSPETSFAMQNNGQWMRNRRSKDENLITKSPEIVSAYPERTQPKLVTKSLEPVPFSESCRSASSCISRKKKSRIKVMRKSWRSVPKMNLSKVAPASVSSPSKSRWKITIKDQRLHRLVFEKDGLPNGTEVPYYSRGQKLLEGYKQGVGIFCRCCNSEVSPSQFEAHAGWASRKKPYSNIYTSNGVSLHELAISLSKGRKYSAKDNDNLCTICADGGNLVLCDGCPRAFHRECATLKSIPPGDWYCHYCQNMFDREKFVNENALAAGRVSGVDPIEDISRRCIRIVGNIGAEVSGCVLCGCYDFSKSGFGPRTIILCDQCEQEFHIGCLRDHKMENLKELPKGKWFCSGPCNRIHSTLQNLLACGAERLQDSLLGTVKKKHEEKGLDMVDGLNVSWRLLNGSFASPESRRLLSEAVAIFHDSFDPIVDWMSGRDLIPSMVYGRSTRGQEYGGMYCAVLIVDSVVVSASILRVFGQEFAELPLVATSKENHNKGYFQLLFSCIEKLLAFLNVKSLILPAAMEAESIWTDRFGFGRMNPDEVIKCRKMGCQMVTFQGTSMLKKPVPQCRIAGNFGS